MKIGVLTLPFNNNYGGLLQAYALQSYLQGRGHQVFSIFQPLSDPKRSIKQTIKRLLKIGSYVDSFQMENFRQHYFLETLPFKKGKDFGELKRYGFDAIVVGSDQVWRLEYIKDELEKYFLAECQEKIKISYAASFGVDDWNGNCDETLIISSLISQFSGVSVRENTGVQICEKYFSRRGVVNLFDPTLLHSANFYRKLYDGSEVKRGNKNGVYFLDYTKDKADFVREIELATAKTSNFIGRIVSKRANREFTMYPKVSKWLYDFDQSDLIITDSYHGMLFSIIYQKPFIVIGNSSRGLERFKSFLKFVRLDDRLVDENHLNAIDVKILLTQFDYTYVLECIHKNRDHSNNYLKNFSL